MSNEIRHNMFYDITKPLYLQLSEILIDKIETEELSVGDELPGERILAEMYSISRVTVRKSIGKLVEEGYLKRSRGKVTKVARRKVNHHVGLLMGIFEELYDSESTITVKEIGKGYQEVTSSVKKQLLIADDEKVFGVTRVLNKDSVQLVVNYSYVPSEIGKLIETLDFSTAKVFTHLENCGYNISYGDEVITAGICNAEEEQYLDYKLGNPVLIINRTSYLENGYPILYEKSIYRGDKYQYGIRLQRKL